MYRMPYIERERATHFQVVNFDPNKDYKVVAGDTGFTIAAKLGITLQALEGCNPTLNLDNLQVSVLLINSFRNSNSLCF